MEAHSCGKCPHLDAQHCIILNKHIFAVNFDHVDICCTPEKRERGLQKFSIKRKQKYPRLESVFGALGYIFNNHHRYKRWKGKRTKTNMTINKHPDGSYKSKDELLDELKGLYSRRIKQIHPDKNSKNDASYYNAETVKINEAYERGKEIIENR